MSKPDSPALQTALAYYDAWRSRDHSAAMNVVADTVVAETPFGRLEGAEALHESETEFANILTGATLIASFGDEDTALLLYNTHTLPVPSVLSAKYFVVDNGKITAIKGLFDRSVFAEAQGESEPGSRPTAPPSRWTPASSLPSATRSPSLTHRNEHE